MKKTLTTLTAIAVVLFGALAVAAFGDNLDAIRVQKALNGQNPAASISTAEIADGAVTSAKIAADTIVAADIAAGGVASSEILDESIAPADVNDGTDGTVVAAAASATESIAWVKSTTITFTNVAPVATDGSDEGESVKIFDLPDGPICILNAVADLSCVTLSGATNTFVCSIGSAAAGDDSALTSTEANVVPSTELDTTAGTVLTNAFDAVLAAPVTLDGTATAADLYFNWAIDDDDTDGDVTNTVSGTVRLDYVVGDDNQ
jgi:hypothetical protein